LDFVRPGGTALLNADDPRVLAMAGRGPGRTVLFGTGLFGSGEECAYRASGASSRWPQRLSFTLHAGGAARAIRTRLVGEHWLPPALAALAVGDRLGVDPEAAAAALARTPPFPGRLSPFRVPSGAVFLRDDYNAAVPSVDASLEVLRRARARRRVLVITD